MLKEVKKDLNNWKNIPVYGLQDNIIKMVIDPRQSRFNAIPIKIPMAFFFFEEMKNQS